MFSTHARQRYGLDLNQVAAYFAYANRTVLGLGVEIEDEEIGLPPTEGEK